MLYNNLSGYLKEKYGSRLSKICIDGGFSCPNRDGVCGVGGCIFCGERGSGEHIDALESIGEQVRVGLERIADGGAIAYFQSYTNTYAPIPVLKKRYDSALISDRIRVLAIGTRPDCISEETAELIASYLDRVDVWVELGLQTSSDITAEKINRGYRLETYRSACEILKRHGIPFVTHMIIGLPNEGEREVLSTVREINASGSWGVKIHSIYVMEGTRLADMYRSGAYTPPTLSEYAELCAAALAHLSPQMTVHRITGDCPRGLLTAPDWNSDKNGIIGAVRKYMDEHRLRQGTLYQENL